MSVGDRIRWYYHQRDNASAPSLNFLDSTGRMYAERCPACRATHRHQNSVKVFVCGRCGCEWPYNDRYILKGEVQRSARQGGFEAAQALWVQVGRVFYTLESDPAWRWDYRLLVANAMGTEVGELKDTFLHHYPNAPGPWGRRSLFNRLKRAREEMERRLEKAEVRV